MDEAFDEFLAEMISVDNDGDNTSVLSDMDATAVHSTDSNPRSKIGRCIVTIFPPDKDVKWLNPVTYFPVPENEISIWCGQFELAPTTDALHAHLYIEFVREPDKRPRFSKLRNIFTKFFESTVNIKRSKLASNTQRQCAVNYVLDESKRAPMTNNFIWDGCTETVGYCDVTKTNKTTKQTDTETQRLWIESKPR